MGNHHSENEISLIKLSDESNATSKFHHNREFMPECIGEERVTTRSPLKDRKNTENTLSHDIGDVMSKAITAQLTGVKTKRQQLLANVKSAQHRRCSIPSIFLRLDAKLSSKNVEHEKQESAGNNSIEKIYSQKKPLYSTKCLPPRHKSSMAILGYERVPPIIQINGVNEMRNGIIGKTIQTFATSSETKTVDFIQKPRAQKMDSRKVTAQRRLERASASQHSQKRRLEYLAGTATIVARSLDEASGSHMHFATDLQRAMMKPLNVCHRNSPLKQMRTYSHRSVSSEDNLLSKEGGAEIRKSWKLANERILQFSSDRCFGFYVLEKVFEKAPKLKAIFGIVDCSIYDIPETHSFSRHIRIFNSIIDLAVRNVDELEAEIAPALFAYGTRHYQPSLLEVFNEESVRMFCGEIVHTMLDLLGDNLTTTGFEAWIELVRYMGTVLLSGFEYKRLTSTKKISINTKQHAYFVL